MINIFYLQKQCSSIIWERGKAYFEDGAVMDLKKINSTEWKALVYGSEKYTVELSIDDNSIEAWDCDCPYDGEVCKHVVAAALALQDEQAGRFIKEKPAKPKPFDELLKSVSKTELVSYLKKYATENSEFKDLFIIHFADKSPKTVAKSYSSIIQKSLKKAMGSYGLINYYDVPTSSKIIFELLDKAGLYFTQKNYIECWQIVKAIIEEISEIGGCIDDSDGEYSSAFEDSMDLMECVLKETQAAFSLKEDIYKWLKIECVKDKYSYYGDDLLFDAIVQFTQINGTIEDVLPLIDYKIKISNSEYEQGSLLKQKWTLLEENGRKSEAEQLIQENIHIKDFRQIKVDGLLQQHLYSDAEQLIKEGITQAERKEYSGFVHYWKEQLLTFYQQQNQKSNYKETLFQLFYEAHGSERIKYYKMLKKNIPKQDWFIERENIIKKIKKQDDNSFLGSLYCMEEMWTELLMLLKKRPSFYVLSQYETYLKKHFPEDLVSLYVSCCEELVKQCSSRPQYKDLVSHLKHLKKLEGGKPVVQNLLDHFRGVYKKHPAMMQELEKV